MSEMNLELLILRIEKGILIQKHLKNYLVGNVES